MPNLGEIQKAKDVGYTYGNGSNKYIWTACARCGKERWVQYIGGKAKSSLCHSCANLKRYFPRGEENPCWNGGFTTNRGYIEVKLQPSDFFYSMTNKSGYVFEHRLVVARALGRNLHRWEIVHHKGTKYPKGSMEDKRDNRYPENLQLVSVDMHNGMTIMEARITHLEGKVQEQTKLIKLLQWQTRELQKVSSFTYKE